MPGQQCWRADPVGPNMLFELTTRTLELGLVQLESRRAQRKGPVGRADGLLPATVSNEDFNESLATGFDRSLLFAGENLYWWYSFV